MSVDIIENKIERHLKDRRPSIERIKTLCEECLERDSSWWVFKNRCEVLLQHETNVIKMLDVEAQYQNKSQDQVESINKPKSFFRNWFRKSMWKNGLKKNA